MSTSRGSRNNVLAGLFVLSALVLLVIVVVVMSNLGDHLTPMYTYIVRFTLSDGAEGLDKGAAVKIGGQRVGRVSGTQIKENKTTGEPEWVDVTVEVPKHYKLYSDADVQLIKPLLGSGSTINIVAQAGRPPEPGAPPSPPRHQLVNDETIIGHLGAPGFITPTDYARIQSIIARVDRITGAAEPRIDQIMDNASNAVTDVRKIAADASEKWPQWSGNVSNVLARVDKASESFDEIIKNLKEFAQAAKDGIDDARKLIDKGRAIVDDNRASIDDIVKNVRDVTDRANKEWSQKLTGLLDQGKAALDSASATVKDAGDLVARKSPQLDDMITDAALAAQQLKLATVEIRASPWRLLYQPTKKELENELLYNSVRQYSDAVGELKAASDSLRAVVKHANESGTSPNQATIDAMTEKLRQAFDKYQQAEKAFMDRWVKDGK